MVNLFVKGLIIALAITAFLLPAHSVLAKTSDTSAILKQPDAPEIRGEDKRIKTLERYLYRHNSPLSQYAEVLIGEADKNSLDWELLPSIAGVESTFGQF